MYKCPECGSTDIITWRHIGAAVTCSHCGYIIKPEEEGVYITGSTTAAPGTEPKVEVVGEPHGPVCTDDLSTVLAAWDYTMNRMRDIKNELSHFYEKRNQEYSVPSIRTKYLLDMRRLQAEIEYAHGLVNLFMEKEEENDM